MLSPEKESSLGCLLMTGIGFLVGGPLLFLMLFVMGGLFSQKMVIWSMLGMLLFLVGLAIVFFCVVGGLRATRRDPSKAKQQTISGCQIVARFAVNDVGEMIFSTDGYAPHELKHYLRVAFPDGRRAEFKTSRVVFDSVGEGAIGQIQFQGDWLGQFVLERPSSRD